MSAEAYTLFFAVQGWMGIVASEQGVRAVYLPYADLQALEARVRTDHPAACLSPSALGDLPQRLQRYVQGEEVGLNDPLDLWGATIFRRVVWEATRDIPYGEVRGYGWLASAIGKPGASRAVGQALGANPVPILVPCHRVVAADGSLCGFTGGLHLKEMLLACEGRDADGSS